MRILSFLLPLLLLYHSGVAQKKNLIIDSLTREPVTYASIACNETGYSTMANEKGEWIFPDSVLCKRITVNCTDCEVQGFTFHNGKWRLRNSKTKANKWAPAVKLKMKYYN